jgi:hypothetical protein
MHNVIPKKKTLLVMGLDGLDLDIQLDIQTLSSRLRQRLVQPDI